MTYFFIHLCLVFLIHSYETEGQELKKNLTGLSVAQLTY
jgi:hypothetical protein